MTEREKIGKGLECIAQKREPTANPCKDCGYSDRPNYAICVKDIASDALELLKEQKPVKPEWYNGRAYCHECGKLFPRNRGEKRRFCSYCGHEVKWE